MNPSSSSYEKLRPMLESRQPEWANVTIKDIEYALTALIRERRWLRKKGRREALSNEDIALMHETGIQLQLLFEGQAIKWGERGPVAIRRKIKNIENRLADPVRMNPYDDILCEKLHEQLRKMERE